MCSLDFLEHDGELPATWWKKALEAVEEHKKQMYGKLNWTPWGHVDTLKKPENHDYVRRLYKNGSVSSDFLKQLGIKMIIKIENGGILFTDDGSNENPIKYLVL